MARSRRNVHVDWSTLPNLGDNFGARMRAWREDLGCAQRQIAEAVQAKNWRTVAAWERGESLPGAKFSKRLDALRSGGPEAVGKLVHNSAATHRDEGREVEEESSAMIAGQSSNRLSNPVDLERGDVEKVVELGVYRVRDESAPGTVQSFATASQPQPKATVTAVASLKGGSGKTTTAINLAEALTLECKRVLLVDVDSQGSARIWTGRADPDGEGRFTTVGMGSDLAQPHQIPALTPHFDHVIIDCPPHEVGLVADALQMADIVIVPVQPTPQDMDTLPDLLQLLAQVQATHRGLEARILITRRVPNALLGGMIRGRLEGKGVPVLKAELTQLVAFQESGIGGGGVLTYAPRSKAATEVQALVKELYGGDV